MSGNHSKDDTHPDPSRDDPGKPRKNVKESLHNTTETMDEHPAGSPNAEKQSRVS